jgi:hypothetical protein
MSRSRWQSRVEARGATVVAQPRLRWSVSLAELGTAGLDDLPAD